MTTPSSYAQILRQHAQERPDAPALTFGDRTWSFAELDKGTSQVGQALRAEGVGLADRVALLTKNCAECFELMFACSKIGAILAGLNWRLSAREIAAIVTDAAPKVLVVSPEEEALLQELPAEFLANMRIVRLGAHYDTWRAAALPQDPGHEGKDEEVALLLYTSGTTGLPKGVMLTNEGMVHTPRLGEAWGMTPDSVNLVAMPMFHIGGCGYGTSTMTRGGHTVLLREVNPAVIVDCIARYRVTHAFLVPTVVQSLLQVEGVEQADLSSMQLLMYGAAPMGDVLLRRAMDMLHCRFIQAYGMTETSGTVAALPPEDHEPEGPRARLLNSVGRAYPWVELRVVDPTTLKDAPTGQVGELWIRSRMVMKGYWNQPKETDAALVDGQWLRTGDAAYLDEQGYIFLFDRFKDMIISGGENIYPAEIENVLNGHPAVREVAVIGVPHEKWGETPRAVVVLRDGQQATPQELMAFTRQHLAHYKCPTSVVFSDVLPRNASGKLLKRELRRLQPEVREGAVR
jgi:acyl-CoA synthetase (AMP-forming)/AMP-acid ligase II